MAIAAFNAAGALPCALNALSFVLDDLLVPELLQFGSDPPDPNFQQVVSPTLPPPITLPDTGNTALNDLFSTLFNSAADASIYLSAVNISYDRYSSAFAAGDNDSAYLQLDAILRNLALYDQKLAVFTQNLGLFRTELAQTALGGLLYDPQAILTAQEDLLNNGMSQSLIDFLTGLGLDPDQISLARGEFLGIDPYSVTGTLDDQLVSVQTAAIQLSAPSSAPEPSSVMLVVFGLVLLTLVRYRYSGASPNRFAPAVPRRKPFSTNPQSGPIIGIRLTKTHQADLSRSCHRLAITATPTHAAENASINTTRIKYCSEMKWGATFKIRLMGNMTSK